MPGRTLSTWYGLGGAEAAGNNAYPEAPPYSRHHAASPFDQNHYNSPSTYGYYNQGSTTPSYPGPDARPYPAQSPSYQPHYTPAPSPSYHYETPNTSQQQSSSSHMSFSRQQPAAQGAAAYSSTAPPAPYNNHRHAGQQHGYGAPAATQHQQWGSYGSSPGPVMGSPSPHRSNPSQAPMSSQFPQSQAQQPPPSHWQSHGHSMHTGSNHNNMVVNMSPPPPSPLQSQTQYYQAPNPQAASPQQLDLSCSSPRQPVDLHSPGPGIHSPGPGIHSPGPNIHSPGPAGVWPATTSRNTSRESSGGSGSPLASLQMLVNQDMNRQQQQAANYPPNAQGMVDLSIPRAQPQKPEELRNGNSTTSPPALNGDLSSSADSGISSPAMTHLQPPPRISVKSPQILAAEVERKVQQRTTPSPRAESQSEPEGSPSPMPREARTKASMKRARKVDAILENLSGTKKKRPATPTTPETPLVPPTNDDSGMDTNSPPNKDLNSPIKEPNSPNKVAKPRSPQSREDTISPSFDDASQDKPRRKRKPDNPIRLKTSEDNKGKSDIGEKSQQHKSADPVKETEDKQQETPAVEEPVKSTVVDLSLKPAKNEGKDLTQVENELAKMFEGLEGEAHARRKSIEDTINAVVAGGGNDDEEPSCSSMSTPTKKRGRPKGQKSDTDSTPAKKKVTSSTKKKKIKSKMTEVDMYSPDPTNSKKKKKKDGKFSDKRKNIEVINPPVVVEKYKGPYVRIEGPKDAPTSVSVYNSTRGEEEDGERPSGSSALKYSRKKLSWHNEHELRHRVQGLGFSSTMASHYDAFRADESWRCAFCKRGSHSEGLGDLFGPYFIQSETSNMRQQVDDSKKGKSKKKRRKSTDDPQKMSKKSKASTSKTETEELPGTWEVWVHEPCAIWAAGVHLVGPRMVGLQEAVQGAATSVCEDCGQTGANLGCVRRICDKRAHYNCARNLDWQLDEEGYISCCSAHKRGVPKKRLST